MSFNFSNLKLVSTANTRTGVTGPRGQNFKMRYKKFITKKNKTEAEDSFFEFSKELLAATGLSDNSLAARQALTPDGKTFLVILPAEHGTIMKQKGDRNKGSKFKSTVIEKALHEQGVIDSTVVGKSQLLDLVLKEENVEVMPGIVAVKIYDIVKVEGDSNDVDAEEDGQVNGDINEGYAEVASDEDDF